MTRDDLAAVLGFMPSDEQWAAISAPLDRPLLVLAGAGSGKTAVMAARVLWAVGSGQVDPGRVLGLTFTNKAAGELGERIRRMLGALDLSASAGEPVVGTYHAFAMELLSEFGLLAGAEPAAALLSPTDLAQATFRSVAGSQVACEQFGTGHIDTVRTRVQSLDEQLSEHLCDPQTLRDFDRRLMAALAGDASKAARDALTAARRRLLASEVVEEVRADRLARAQVGFADLMRMAVTVSAVPRVGELLRARFGLVLVDEYQDTSVAQARLLAALFGDGFPLTAVGDPLQAIYGWRGASVANIDGFPAAFGADVHALTINRRSGRRILDVANAVAEPVRSHHPGVQVLRATGEQTGRVEAGLFAGAQEEAAWLAARVRAELDAGTAADEIAVLCRTNQHVAHFAAALRAAGIPTSAAALGSALHLPEVVEVLSVLRVLHDGDNAALIRLLTGPQWRIGPADLAALGARAVALVGPSGGAADFPGRVHDAVAGIDPMEVATLVEAVYDPGPGVGAEARARLRELVAQLDAIRPALTGGVEEAAHRVVDVTGLAVEVRLGPRAASRLDGLAALFDLIGVYRSGHDDPSVAGFLTWLAFAEQLGETPDTDLPVRGGAVQVMSVHRAKGLEWDCVFVPALSAGIFPSSRGRALWTTHYEELPYPLRGDRSRLPHLPHWTAQGGDFPAGFSAAQAELKQQCRDNDAQEENRLAYVALTRARSTLCATGHWYSQGGQQRSPSPYLLTLRDVPGVEIAHWVSQCPPDAPRGQQGDVDWPGPAVFAEIAEPALPDEPLTLAESARLAALDADIEAVHAWEVTQSTPLSEVAVPRVLSTTLLMRIAEDPAAAAADIARPMPRITTASARRGTAFHEWVAASNQQLALLPEWELAADADRVADDDLAELIAGYRRSPYAGMVPHAVETEVVVPVAGAVVRGVIDAVYRLPDGTWEVVDWKTSRQQRADPLQLAVYRQGWALHRGVPPEQVRAVFVYVRDGEVVHPELPDLPEGPESHGGTSYKENSAVTAQ